MSVDAIGDFLTVMRNGIIASKRSVMVPYSKMREAIAGILKQEGFIKDFEVLTVDESSKKNLKVNLKYVDGESVIHEITRISTPGRRMYSKVTQMKVVKGKLGISIVTTNKGIMTDKQAKDLSVGGEIICSVW